MEHVDLRKQLYIFSYFLYFQYGILEVCIMPKTDE